MTRLGLLVSVVSLVATGCLSSSSKADDAVPLAQDTYYTGYPAQYSSPADCLAHSQHPHGWDCSFEIALCANGKAGLRFGDIVTSGTYAVDAGIARGMIETEELALEVATAAEPEGPIIDGIRWQLDTEGRWTTLQFDVISCD